jgi:hypothetical protein
MKTTAQNIKKEHLHTQNKNRGKTHVEMLLRERKIECQKRKGDE